jgi:threonine/homoserine efflux transporter RhtA
MNQLDLGELIKRAIKYLVEGIMVGIVASVIPKQKLKLEEVALIALTAAATFSILDTYVPSMAASARSGGWLRDWCQSCWIPKINPYIIYK